MGDITYLRSRIRGRFCYLHVFTDPYGRSGVAAELSTWESAENAALIIRSICMDHGRLSTQPLILHCDNGAVMKYAQMPAALAGPGITASCSRPRVSHDSPFAESLFRTLKTRHDYPAQGKDHKEQARSCVAAAVSWINPQHRPGTSAASLPCSGAGVRIACVLSGAPRLRLQPAGSGWSAGTAAAPWTGERLTACSGIWRGERS